MKITQHQFRQALASTAKIPVSSVSWTSAKDDLTDDFRCFVTHVEVTWPVETDSIFVMPERIPIFHDIQKKKRSTLAQLLLDRNDETALVVDSFLGGKDSLFLAKLVESTSSIRDWVDNMSLASISLTIRPIDEQYKIMVTSLSSFVSRGAS
jgi:hypothetical protein